jgi:hypothetical protein
MLLETKGDTEDNSAPKSAVEKPPSTLEMSAGDAEDMANEMLLDSPHPDVERSNEGLPEGRGSDKLPKGGGEKLPEEEGSKKQPEETHAGKLVIPCT